MTVQENKPVSSRTFSARSILFLGLLVGIGAGATAYVVGIAIAALLSVPSAGVMSGQGHQTRFYDPTQLLSGQGRGSRLKSFQAAVCRALVSVA